jgi:hypothetical protein
MSIDIGIVSGDADPSTLIAHRAQSLWRDSPDAAFAGDGLLSAESQSDMDRSLAIVSLATDAPDRFISLVSHLTPIVQDILYQHYLLGRTYEQIGRVLFPGHVRLTQPVQLGNRLGLRALCAVIKCRGNLARLPRRGPLAAAWRDMLEWHPRVSRRPVRLRSTSDLGSFVIAPNGQLGELFAPAWSILTSHRSLGGVDS